MDLAPEVLERIIRYLGCRELLAARAICTYFRNVINVVYFKFPNFKTPVEISALTHLPIQILRFSQVHGLLEICPESLTTFIIDTRNPLNPRIIKENTRVNFIMALHHLREPHKYHFSHYLLENVKLYTTCQCAATVPILQTFRDFTFKALSISHIETFPYSDEDIFDFVISLKIERLTLDYLEKKISPERVVGLKNLVHLSSNIFDRFQEFPIKICALIPSLESIHLRFHTFVHFGDFASLLQNIKMAFLNNVTVTPTNIDFIFSKLFFLPGEGVVRVRSETSIRVKMLPERWIQSLEHREARLRNGLYHFADHFSTVRR